MPRASLFLLLFILFAFCLASNGVYAFGAGNIPSFAYMEGRAFRHGDIEDTLGDLIKRVGGGFALTSILSKGSKFNGLDVKRVYFGNWLRDYSQAMDIAAFKKMPVQTILNLLMVLGFMAHGYATHEFEVTPDRVGVYLPVEHIDNPKGYGDGEDPRKYNPKLRPPVEPIELEVDTRTGMKNYIANENGRWDTSKGLVRRLLTQCIHLGRKHRAEGSKYDEYEAYRLLGTLLHTLEDFTAHSNFCEITLHAMGYTDVFLHVGDQVRIQSPGGKWVAPIVTGTFGSNDFFHSLLGEASDHLSQASVTDINRELDKARTKSLSQGTRSGPGGPVMSPTDVLRDLFFSLPGGEGGEMSRELDSVERIRASAAQGTLKPEEMSPQELHSVLWQVLTFRDSVAKKISKTIEKIPGLGPLIEKISDSISVFVFTTLEPFLKPLLKTTTSGLQDISSEVINSHDQYEVFNDPRASDPTHSFLSKDHFNLVLNEPAGQIAKVVVTHTVNLVVKAWDDTSLNVNNVIEDILQAMFHPDFHNPNSKVQREMLQCMHDWVNKLGHNRDKIIGRLNKESVRNHKNVRLAGEGGTSSSQGTFAQTEGLQAQHTIQGYINQIPGVAQAQQFLGGGAGGRKDIPGGFNGPDRGFSSADYRGSAPPPPASSYYSGSSSSGPPTPSYAPPHGPPLGSYAPPPGPPPAVASPYAPPSDAPPSFPSAPHHDGYNPSYAPSYASPGRVSFPGGPTPSFPGGPDHHAHSTYPGGGPPSFPNGPGGYASPSGPPPNFPGGIGFPSPDAPPMQFPGGPHEQYHHQPHHQYGGGQGGW